MPEEAPRHDGETARIMRQLRSTFLAVNATLVAVAATTCGVVHYLHRDHVTAAEIAVSAVAVLVVLPSIVHLLYARSGKVIAAGQAARQAAAAHAQLQSERLEMIVNALLDPIVSIDARGRVLTANPAVERVFGWAPRELIGNDVRQLMAEPYRSEHGSYIERYLRTGEAHAIGRIRSVIGRRRNGEDFACELSVSELVEHGERRFVGVVRDISEREALVARLAQVERLAAVGELAAGIAHEVNNPVNTIINCARSLADGDEDPQLTEDIISEGMRIAAIVRDLLDFSRDRREEHSATAISEVVRRTVSLIARRLDRAGVRLTVDVPDDLPPVRGRLQQLQQVLLNLLLNSRDAVTADPRTRVKEVRVSARTFGAPDNAKVCLSVWDNGPGIAPENLDKVFRPFFTTKATGGNGLGLAVSQGIVRDHLGTLSVSSVPGEFCEFIVTLPVDPEFAGAGEADGNSG